VSLLRPFFESLLFKATQAGLPSWQRSLLAWALRKDEALRCLALELAEFNSAEAPERAQEEIAPDFAPRLMARIAADARPLVERPLFPSGWVPAGAIAVLLVTGWVALSVKPAADGGRSTNASDSSASASQAIEALVPPTPAPQAKPALLNPSAAGLSNTAKTPQVAKIKVP
jgi:hypothetical protein